MTASRTGRGGSEAPALFRWTTLRQPGVSARARSTSICISSRYRVRSRSSSRQRGQGGQASGPAAVHRGHGARVGSPSERRSRHAAPGSRSRFEVKGRAGRGHHGGGARPGPRGGAGPGAGVRCLPHRPALPRGRHQRGLPLPARPRGGGQGRGGRPWYCFDSRNATRKMTLEDGVELSAAIGVGAFAELTLVAAGQAVKVDPAARPEAAGLVGCGVMAGFGAALHTGNVQRGDTVAVFGCGGVGDAAIHAAALVGARRIIAIDVDARKLEWARQFGATDTIDASQQDVVSRVRELTGGFGADVTIEAVGRPEVFKQAFHARDHAGTLVQVGVPDPQMRLDVRMLDFFGRGGALKPSWYGDCLPSRDFPILIDLYLRGRYDLDRFVSDTISLDQVEDAFTRMHRGEVLRSVVVL